MNGSSKRDQAVERLLRQSSSTTAAPPADAAACLDAETLAMWMDGALSAAALQSAEAHVSGCRRCQAMVGAFARMEPAVHASAGIAGVNAGVRRWLGWFVPLTAAVAVALWVMVPRPEKTPAAGNLSARVEPAPSSPAAVAPEEMRRRQGEAAAADALQDSRAVAADKAESPATAQAPAQRKAQRVDRAAESQRRERDAQESADSSAATDHAAAVAAPPAAVAGALEERVVVAEAPAASPAAAPVPAGTTIASPDPAVRWRLLGSRVEHTVDGGATWQTVFQRPEMMLTTGAAPSATVCWIVGPAGAVIRTTDGRSFARVPFPSTRHLVAVSATDAETASVTTASGGTFVTANGGATWTER